ncbi:MAG: hypothetical protein LAN64_01085, partial [Acidobacteriia bacterium]|nr:hypothetical protein [Terriglobia bacterium]
MSLVRLSLILVATFTALLATAQNLAVPPVAETSVSNRLTSSASLPRLIRFGGIAHNPDRSPRTGTVGMTFALYSESEGGAPLWQEVQNVTLDAGGHYSVLLGANSKDGVPMDLFTTNEARWLGVQVEQEAEQPRVLLVSVPYALKAGDAETVGGHPLSDFVMTPAADASSGSSGSTASSTTAGASTVKKSANA